MITADDETERKTTDNEIDSVRAEMLVVKAMSEFYRLKKHSTAKKSTAQPKNNCLAPRTHKNISLILKVNTRSQNPMDPANIAFRKRHHKSVLLDTSWHIPFHYSLINLS